MPPLRSSGFPNHEEASRAGCHLARIVPARTTELEEDHPAALLRPGYDPLGADRLLKRKGSFEGELLLTVEQVLDIEIDLGIGEQLGD
jgi:hypothetical protein